MGVLLNVILSRFSDMQDNRTLFASLSIQMLYVVAMMPFGGDKYDIIQGKNISVSF
jgi:hypothetical protein